MTASTSATQGSPPSASDPVLKSLPFQPQYVDIQDDEDGYFDCTSGDQVGCGMSFYALMAWTWQGPSEAPEYDEAFYGQPFARAAITVEYGIGGGRLLGRLRPTFGVDGTPQMVQRCEALHTGSRLLVGDVRTIKLPESADYAYCAGGTLNNVTSEASLTRAFNNISTNLTANGSLRFDIISPAFYTDVVARVVNRWHIETANQQCRVRARYRQISATEYSHEYALERPNLPTQYRHLHEARHSIESLRSSLIAAGFTHISFQSSPDNSEFKPHAHVLYVTAEKGKR